MTRIIKAPDVRRSEILDVTQRLFYLKGYEQTSIQDIITEIGIAKGTFYHYFSSKQDLLDAMIERMIEQTLQTVEPIVNDDQLNALEKFTQFFAYIESWKIENKTFLLEVLKVWHKDENAIFRQKMGVETTRAVAPVLAKIIKQGVVEGIFVTDYPEDLAEVILQIGQPLSETATELLLNVEQDDHTLEIITRKVIVYERAIERVLGAPPNSLKLFDLDIIKLWFE
jgi:AcrR family transcriptional regulator